MVNCTSVYKGRTVKGDVGDGVMNEMIRVENDITVIAKLPEKELHKRVNRPTVMMQNKESKKV